MIEAEMHFSNRTDSEVVAASRTLSAQYAAFVTTMSRRLLARANEVDRLNKSNICSTSKLANKGRKNKRLKQENKDLTELARILKLQIEESERVRVQAQSQHQQIMAAFHERNRDNYN